MSSTTVCKGWCVPLYIYAFISALNLGAHLVWGNAPFFERIWNAATSAALMSLYGLVVFLICQSCQTNSAYLALIPPSLLFGLQMFVLLALK